MRKGLKRSLIFCKKVLDAARPMRYNSICARMAGLSDQPYY